MNRLTTKQQAWVEAMLTGVTPTEAGRQAKYANPKKAGHENGTKGYLTEAITKRRAEIQAETGYSVIQAQKEYEEARLHAASLKQPSAEVSAVTGKARLFGFDKTVDIKGEEPNQLSNDDLALLRTLARAVTDKGLSGPQVVKDECRAYNDKDMPRTGTGA